jgi:DNA-binding MarR family transcriptional regulator
MYSKPEEFQFSDGRAGDIERLMFLEYLLVFPGGLTDERMTSLIGSTEIEISHIGARRLQLEKSGLVEPRGVSASTKGRRATRYSLTEEAATLLDNRYPGVRPASARPQERWSIQDLREGVL